MQAEMIVHGIEMTTTLRTFFFREVRVETRIVKIVDSIDVLPHLLLISSVLRGLCAVLGQSDALRVVERSLAEAGDAPGGGFVVGDSSGSSSTSRRRSREERSAADGPRGDGLQHAHLELGCRVD